MVIIFLYFIIVFSNFKISSYLLYNRVDGDGKSYTGILNGHDSVRGFGNFLNGRYNYFLMIVSWGLDSLSFPCSCKSPQKEEFCRVHGDSNDVF